MKGRKEIFGIICRVVIDKDKPSKKNKHRTMVFRKDLTPHRPDYRDLMAEGGEGWRKEHSNRKLLEWGTPTDYLGNGKKLFLFDTYSREITVEADIDPDQCFEDPDNYYKIRNVIIEDSLHVLKRPITLGEITLVHGLESFQNYRQFKEINKEQYESLMEE